MTAEEISKMTWTLWYGYYFKEQKSNREILDEITESIEQLIDHKSKEAKALILRLTARINNMESLSDEDIIAIDAFSNQ